MPKQQPIEDKSIVFYNGIKIKLLGRINPKQQQINPTTPKKRAQRKITQNFSWPIEIENRVEKEKSQISPVERRRERANTYSFCLQRSGNSGLVKLKPEDQKQCNPFKIVLNRKSLKPRFDKNPSFKLECLKLEDNHKKQKNNYLRELSRKEEQTFNGETLIQQNSITGELHVDKQKTIIKDEDLESKKLINKLSLPVPRIIENRYRWEFATFFQFLRSFYIEREYLPYLVDSFNRKEIFVFCKFINRSQCTIEKFQRNKQKLLTLANKVFNGVEVRRRGYKITNNKRFVFRKIKAIMVSKFAEETLKVKTSKKEKDELFFFHYFQNRSQYKQMSPTERTDLESFLNIYEESKINLVWQFTDFLRDFSLVFFEFPDYLTKTYYREKVARYRTYLLDLTDRSTEEVFRARLPVKSLPINHNIIKEYMRDFKNSFGHILIYPKREKEV